MTNRIGIDQVEKVIPVGDDRIVQTDSENSNNTVWSKLSNIATAIFGLKTTTDLEEGTNLYYTDARVSANTTLLSKADKTNILQLDNTTPYTPTEDYHPATKEYVDSVGLPVASETLQGIIELATDTEVNTGTDTTRAITPKTLRDNYSYAICIASNNQKAISATQVTLPYSASLVATGKKIRTSLKGVIRVKFDMAVSNTFTATGRIYVNGVAVGTSYTTSLINGNFATFQNDISVNTGDIIEIYGRYDDAGAGGNGLYKNMTFSYDKTLFTGDYLIEG